MRQYNQTIKLFNSKIIWAQNQQKAYSLFAHIPESFMTVSYLKQKKSIRICAELLKIKTPSPLQLIAPDLIPLKKANNYFCHKVHALNLIQHPATCYLSN